MHYIDCYSENKAYTLLDELKNEGYNACVIRYNADSYQVRYWK